MAYHYRDKNGVNMEIWAHRGASKAFIENTMDAFRNAVDMNVHGLELDVRLCASGEAVVFHDPTLWRLCRKFVPVKYTSLSKLQEYNLDDSGSKILTLAQVLKEFGDKTHLVLDLKNSNVRNAQLERAVKNDILEHAPNSIDKITISSKSALSLCKSYALFGDMRPELALILEKQLIPDLSYYALKFDALHVDKSLVTKSQVSKWHKMGLRVRAWTVNLSSDAEQMALDGVDGIFTDIPEEMI